MDIALGPFDKCRAAPEAASDRLRLLHQDDADGRRDEDVEPGERDELLLLRLEELRVRRRHLREDDRELTVRDERHARVEALARREAAGAPCEVHAADLADDG